MDISPALLALHQRPLAQTSADHQTQSYRDDDGDDALLEPNFRKTHRPKVLQEEEAGLFLLMAPVCTVAIDNTYKCGCGYLTIQIYEMKLRLI